MLKTVRLTAPVGADALAALEIGSVVYLDGVLYTGREGVYQRALEEGVPLPCDLRSISNVNFHCSPAAARRDDGSYVVGAVTATASFRFTKWMDRWFAMSGAKVIIGKGGMTSKDYKSHFVPNGAVYLTTVGYGTGALLGRGIVGVKDVHWFDVLGVAQALWVLEVRNFGPLLVESDLAGRSLFEREGARVAQGLAKLYEGTRPPALRRYGETDDRSEELI